MQEQLKALRVEIDGLFKITSTIHPPSRETALAKTHFEEAKMALGKVLGYLGAANPYPESKNPESKVIEKTADTEERNFFFPDPTDRIGNVKKTRLDADEIGKKIEVLLDTEVEGKIHARVPLFLCDAFLSLSKGMMWLGMELGRIKAEADKKALEEMGQTNGPSNQG